jgi:hypothetical protein
MNTRNPPTENLHPRVAASFALVPIVIGSVALPALLPGLQTPILTVALLVIIPPGLVFGVGLFLWRPALERSPRTAWRFNLVCGLYTVVILTGAVFSLLGGMLGIGLTIVAGVLGAGVGFLVLSTIVRSPESNPLACANCDYDLRGQYECRCPECGHEYTVGDIVRNQR